MDHVVQGAIRTAIIQLINETASDKSLKLMSQKHDEKLHFVPMPYRILGGVLQSLNIKFGNFIEKLVALVIEQDMRVRSVAYSGRKLPLSMSAETDALIDEYITARQLATSPEQADVPFKALQEQIFALERRNNKAKQTIRKDVDTLFQTQDGRFVYLEIKYNDDHDTGKHVDIHRKLIKTYAGLLNQLEVEDINQLKPILYYFNPTRRYGAVYLPTSHIYRGAQLFDEYFATRYSDIDAYLRQIGDDPAIIDLFDELYQRIRKTR